MTLEGAWYAGREALYKKMGRKERERSMKPRSFTYHFTDREYMIRRFPLLVTADVELRTYRDEVEITEVHNITVCGCLPSRRLAEIIEDRIRDDEALMETMIQAVGEQMGDADEGYDRKADLVRFCNQLLAGLARLQGA